MAERNPFTVWLLERIGKPDPDKRTLGSLIFDHREIAKTAELPDRDNEPNVSCVCTGLFEVTLHEDGTRLRLHDVPRRSGIRAENGNDPLAPSKKGGTASRGCIFLGDSYMSDGRGVLNSVATLARVRALAAECLEVGKLYVRIRWAA